MNSTSLEALLPEHTRYAHRARRSSGRSVVSSRKRGRFFPKLHATSFDVIQHHIIIEHHMLMFHTHSFRCCIHTSYGPTCRIRTHSTSFDAHVSYTLTMQCTLTSICVHARDNGRAGTHSFIILFFILSALALKRRTKYSPWYSRMPQLTCARSAGENFRACGASQFLSTKGSLSQPRTSQFLK